MVARVVTTNDAFDSIINVVGVSAPIPGVQVLALQAQIIAGCPDLAKEKQSDVETAIADDHARFVDDGKLGLMDDIISRGTWSGRPDPLKVDGQLPREPRFQDTLFPDHRHGRSNGLL